MNTETISEHQANALLRQNFGTVSLLHYHFGLDDKPLTESSGLWEQLMLENLPSEFRLFKTTAIVRTNKYTTTPQEIYRITSPELGFIAEFLPPIDEGHINILMLRHRSPDYSNYWKLRTFWRQLSKFLFSCHDSIETLHGVAHPAGQPVRKRREATHLLKLYRALGMEIYQRSAYLTRERWEAGLKRCQMGQEKLLEHG